MIENKKGASFVFFVQQSLCYLARVVVIAVNCTHNYELVHSSCRNRPTESVLPNMAQRSLLGFLSKNIKISIVSIISMQINFHIFNKISCRKILFCIHSNLLSFVFTKTNLGNTLEGYCLDSSHNMLPENLHKSISCGRMALSSA